MRKIDPNKKQKVKNIIDKLQAAKKQFRPNLVIFWDYNNKILKNLNDQEGITISLPAFNNPYVTLLAEELKTIYTSQDDYVGYSHLTYISALFDVLVYTVNTGGPLDEFLHKLGVESKDIAELILARETRNCHIHNESKASLRWIKAYHKAKNKMPSIRKDEQIKHAFRSQQHYKLLQQIEDWQELLLVTSDKIYRNT